MEATNVPAGEKAGAGDLGAMGGVVLNLAPEIGPWLFGRNAVPVAGAVQAALLRATGSNDPAVQAPVLADPDKATALRVALGHIAADQMEAHGAEAQALLLAGLAGAMARSVVPPVVASSAISYGAPLVSLVVLVTFALVVAMAFTRSMPQGAEPVLNVLLGTLGAMATSVVGYWVGSSAGSARKDDRLATLAERN